MSLPFPPRTIGLPYHGKVVDEEVTLPNAETLQAPAFVDGAINIVRHPNPPTFTRTVKEAAHDVISGQEWRDYALMTSRGRYLGGVSLGLDKWIYIDGNGVPWVLNAEILNETTTSFTVVVNLISIFGRIKSDAETRYPSIGRQLLQLDFTHAALGYVSKSLAPEVYEGWLTEPSETGSKCAINIYLTGQDCLMFRLGHSPGSGDRGCGSIIEIAISGNGSTETATLGDGITCAVTRQRDWDELNPNVGQSISITTPEWVNDPSDLDPPDYILQIDLPVEQGDKTGCTFVGDPPEECCATNEYTADNVSYEDSDYYRAFGSYIEVANGSIRGLYVGETFVDIEIDRRSSAVYSTSTYDGEGWFERWITEYRGVRSTGLDPPNDLECYVTQIPTYREEGPGGSATCVNSGTPQGVTEVTVRTTYDSTSMFGRIGQINTLVWEYNPDRITLPLVVEEGATGNPFLANGRTVGLTNTGNITAEYMTAEGARLSSVPLNKRVSYNPATDEWAQESTVPAWI